MTGKRKTLKKEAAAAKTTADPDDRPSAAAIVTNLYLKGAWFNPGLVSGLVDGRSVRIRVKTRAAFAPGMTVPVKRVDDGLYEATVTPKKRAL